MSNICGKSWAPKTKKCSSSTCPSWIGATSFGNPWSAFAHIWWKKIQTRFRKQSNEPSGKNFDFRTSLTRFFASNKRMLIQAMQLRLFSCSLLFLFPFAQLIKSLCSVPQIEVSPLRHHLHNIHACSIFRLCIIFQAVYASSCASRRIRPDGDIQNVIFNVVD